MRDREALIYLLTNESSITSLLSTRADSNPAIYYGQIPKEESGRPCIVIFRNDQATEAVIMKDSSFTLNVYGNSLGESEDVALAIYDYLHTAKGTTDSGFSFGKILVQQLGSFAAIENYYSVLNVNFQYRSKQEL